MKRNTKPSIAASHPRPRNARQALFAGALLFSLAAASSVQAQVIYSQDFNAAGATAQSVGWNGGWVFPGGDSDIRSVTAVGLAGSGALVTSVNVTDGPSLYGYTEFSDWALALPAGANKMNVSLTADVTGSRSGAPFGLTLDDHQGHTIVFHSRIASAGKFQTVGGRLGGASSVDPAFDFGSSLGYSISLSFEGDAAWTKGTQTLTIDNVILKSVSPAGTDYVQDFELPGAEPSTLGWGGGFAYSGGDSETHAIADAGVGGSKALVTSVNVTDPANLGAFTEYWSGTMKLPPGSDAYNLMLTADVTGSKAGLPFSLKLNDHNTPSKNITFNGVVGKAGVFQQIGGRLSLASSVSSSFDYASSNGYSIILAFNPGPAWDLGTNTLTIDNVVLQTVARSGTNYTQGFDAPGATPSSVGWNGGFAYSGGSGATKAITQTGVGGSGALVTSVNVTDPANLGAFTEYWSGTMKLPNNSTSNSLFLTAQVTANQSGVPFSLRFNDHGSPTSHYITFTGTIGTAGVFQTVGGRLADASSVDSNFDFASTNGYSLMLTFNPSANWAAGTATLTIDNVVLQTVTPVAGFPVNLAKGPSQAVLTWPTKAGQDYAVQFQDALTGSGWFNLASPVRAAGTTTSYTNSTTDVASRFYRIEVQ